MTTLPASVLAAHAAPTMSSRYVHVNSHEVVRLMEAEGFYVAAAKTAAPRARDPMYARHSLEFRHQDAREVNGATPRVIFVNSHDGTTAATAMAGMYRFVCSNGLVVGQTMESVKQRHSGDAAYELINRMRSLAKNTEGLFGKIDQWSRKDLSKAQRHEFARYAAQLRWNDSGLFEPEELLRVRREEDDRGDLWTTFNRLQENTVRGGLVGLSRSGRQATSRPLTDIQRDLTYNAQLWQLADELAEAW